MLLKSADDKENQITVLKNLLSHEKISPEKKQWIDKELRNLKTGIDTEKQAAFELDFYFGPSKKHIILHDLRLEIDGRVAQIDHLIFNRMAEVYVIETKTFNSGLTINAAGEFSTVYEGKALGISSPIEQNARHIAVLRDAFKLIGLPTRLGVPLMPSFIPVVLVSPKALITRPDSKKNDFSSVMKLDQFSSWYLKRLDDPIRPQDFIDIFKASSLDTIKGLAEKIVELHKPGRVDYVRKFDLAETLLRKAPSPAAATLLQQASTENPAIDNDIGKRLCAGCNTVIHEVVAKFCLNNFRRFKGKTYCRPCQAKF
ncbi:nuclease-related domain-containing protein [Collimonas antrihumi]|uniref:nuclease-related domain-containing protein n=1 Tax=Collimonas antrihumi TaxID=1940615 RepID=UPI001B8B58E0|nr:nuclease-related domain-containing protein [Collimonas antrihumi]